MREIALFNSIWSICVINYIVNSIDDKYTVYSDLPGHTAPGGGYIPPELCVTSQKPDIVIIYNHMKVTHLLAKHIQHKYIKIPNLRSYFGS